MNMHNNMLPSAQLLCLWDSLSLSLNPYPLCAVDGHPCSSFPAGQEREQRNELSENKYLLCDFNAYPTLPCLHGLNYKIEKVWSESPPLIDYISDCMQAMYFARRVHEVLHMYFLSTLTPLLLLSSPIVSSMAYQMDDVWWLQWGVMMTMRGRGACMLDCRVTACPLHTTFDWMIAPRRAKGGIIIHYLASHFASWFQSPPQLLATSDSLYPIFFSL